MDAIKVQADVTISVLCLGNVNLQQLKKHYKVPCTT